MTREEKQKTIDELSARLQAYPHFYVVDMEGLNAEATSLLRRKCFEHKVKLVVVKNTLFAKALELQKDVDFSAVISSLKGASAVFFAEVANEPAKLIKEYRKEHEKPLLKVAYAEESVYVGDNHLDALASLKSKNELIADVMALLQSPAKSVVSALQTGGSKLSGIVKVLAERQ